MTETRMFIYQVYNRYISGLIVCISFEAYYLGLFVCLFRCSKQQKGPQQKDKTAYNILLVSYNTDEMRSYLLDIILIFLYAPQII